MDKEGILLAHDFARHLENGFGALIETADEPGGVRVAFGQIGFVLFACRPGLFLSLLILFASGLFASYQLAANAAFVSAAPQERRSQAFGLAQGGMSLGQGVVMVLAGAAADHHSPALVISVCGAVGAVLAMAIALSWLRDRNQAGGRRKRI